MTDAPPDSGAAGDQPAPTWDPSGIRRSNFTPPPPGAEPPTFDDDALAEAMAAEVSTYTSEIKLPLLPPPSGAEFDAAPPVTEAPAAEVPAPPIPLVEPARYADAGLAAATTPIATPQDPVGSAEPSTPEEEELRRAIGGASTLEAMERLENEYRRLTGGESPSRDLPAPEAAAEPVAIQDPASDPEDPFAWLASVAAPAAAPAPSTPLPGTDALGWNDHAPEAVAAPSAEPQVEPILEPIVEPEPEPEPEAEVRDAPEPAIDPTAGLGEEIWSLFPDPATEAAPVPDQSVVDVPVPDQSVFDLPVPDQSVFDLPVVAQSEPAAAEPQAFSWLFPAATEPASGEDAVSDVPVADEPVAFPSLAPTADTASMSFPGLTPVDHSLIDPVAAAAAVAAIEPAVAPPVAPEPVPVPEDGVWDLDLPDEAPVAAPIPSIAAAAAAAADVAAASVAPELPAPAAIESAASEPPTPEPPALEPVALQPPALEPAALEPAVPVPAAPAPAAPAPDADPIDAWPPLVSSPALVPIDPGMHPAVPYSIDPPVGPESPDWLDAPPPVYTPPELVDPPAFVDGVNPALDPVAPITAQTMSRLPLPLPTQHPNLEDRAELPPPPGYEDIPILSSDAAAQATTIAPMFFSTPRSEPLLPVPPSAAPYDLTPPEAEPERAEAAPEPDEPGGGEAPSPAPTIDHQDDDDIDEVDRVSATATATGVGSSAAVAAVPLSSAGTVEPIAAAPEPTGGARPAAESAAEPDDLVRDPSAIVVETAGLEPTPLDQRAGRASRLFWLWFAANSSVVSMGLGAVLLGTGMSLRQAIVATLAGVAISFLPLGLGTLAGKWSGQPTMVVSRAAFGLTGNVIPALLAVISRLLWGGILLWVLATAVAQVLVGAGLDLGLGAQLWQLVSLVAGFVVATVVAVFGYGLLAKLQLVLTVVNTLLIVGAAALTFQKLDVAKALTVPDGSWVLPVGGAVIVFSAIGLAWVHSSSDLARYQRPGSSGGGTMLWAGFGATLPPFLLICWGALLAASDPALASAMRANPLAAIASLLPSWYPVPLLAAAALGLLSAAAIVLYSGGFAFQAVGLRMRRSLGTLIAAVLVLAIGGALIFVAPDFSSIVQSVIVTLAVPVAAWAGIFAAEMMIRTRRFHTESLLAPGGIYPRVRWINLVALIVISAVGYGFVTSNVIGFGWEGYLFTAIGVVPGDPFGSSNAGVLVALVLGIVVPLATAISTIRAQEAAVPAGAVDEPAAPIVRAPAAIEAPVARS